MIARHSDGPPLLVRAIWFVFIGWWLTGLVNVLAYLIALTIIGLPLAFMISTGCRPCSRCDRAPCIRRMRVGGRHPHHRDPRPPARLLPPRRLLRIDRLVVRRDLVGLAWLLCITVIGIPVGVMM